MSATGVSGIADAVAQSAPALLSLAVSINGNAAGGHYVVAIGIAADGSVVIHDPNSTAARTSLSDYLNGFTLNGAQVKAELKGVVRFNVTTPAGTRFLLAAPSQSLRRAQVAGPLRQFGGGRLRQRA